MNPFGKKNLNKLLIAGILWLGLATWAYGSSSEELRSRLELARENLRISEATETGIASELEKLRNSGTASPQVLEEYEAYLVRATRMVVEDRKIVKEMEAAYAKLVPPRQGAGSSTKGRT
jgi:hypothetical protein